MIDKITLHINNTNTEVPLIIENILSSSSFNQTRSTASGFTGKFKNMSIAYNGHRLTIAGSLTKYGYGYNSINADKPMVKTFVKKLIKDLQIKPSTTIDQIEVGFNLSVDFPPSVYIAQLIQGKGYPIVMRYRDKQVKFIHSNKEIRIYDKTEHFYQGLSFNKYFSNNLNILRYEIISKRPQKSFGLKLPLKLAHLLSSIILDKMVCCWVSEFDKIVINPSIISEISIDSPNDFKHHLILKGVEAYGGVEKTIQYINQARIKNHPNQYKKRMSDFILRICRTSKLTRYPDTIKELRDKIHFTALSCISPIPQTVSVD